MRAQAQYDSQDLDVTKMSMRDDIGIAESSWAILKRATTIFATELAPEKVSINSSDRR